MLKSFFLIINISAIECIGYAIVVNRNHALVLHRSAIISLVYVIVNDLE